MNVSEKIRQQIQSIPEDTTFGYEQLGISKDEFQAAAKILERLQKNKTIKKLSKGVFYKARKTVFGELKPPISELLNNYLFENSKRIAYVTGTHLYNELGLTTQMAFRIKIASRNKRIFINTAQIKATPVKSYADVTEENYQLLGFLDAMKDLNYIPDANYKSILTIFCEKIKMLNDNQKQDLIKYALIYPPRVRALLGAILEYISENINTTELYNSINPLTKFELRINSKLLSTASKWNIV